MPTNRVRNTDSLFVIGLLLIMGCTSEQPVPVPVLPESVPTTTTIVKLELPDQFPRPLVPDHNPLTGEKIELGRKLFFDEDLSLDRSMSCATCHDPDKAWTNGEQFAIGVTGESGNRNVPTVINAAYYHRQFWDGRVASLESQSLGPLTNPIEMAMPNLEAVLERIREKEEYVTEFQRAFANGLTIGNVARAIAAFERTVLVCDTPYDRYLAGDEHAMSESAVRGLEVFRKQGRCAGCHTEPLLTDNQFYNLGVGMDAKDPDMGRFAVTKLTSNIGRFKTPTLRDVSKTAPYMHDGSIKTLEEVIEIYDKGGTPNPQLSDQVRKLKLSDQEKKDLLQFMVEGLTSEAVTPVAYTPVADG